MLIYIYMLLIGSGLRVRMSGIIKIYYLQLHRSGRGSDAF